MMPPPAEPAPVLDYLTATRPAGVLADLAPVGRRAAVPSAAWDAALIVAAALVTALFARIVVPLPFTPVPVTGQTFAVLLTAAALGPWRGAAGQAAYVLMGAAGLPFFSGGASGVGVVFGATGGYLVGFVAAAALTGWLARRGWDRRFWPAAGAMTLGTAVILACGVAWLAVVADLSPAAALEKGLYPFVVGGVLKIALAAGLLPAAWRVLR